LSLKTKVDGLLVVWPQNHCDGFFFDLASKPVAVMVFSNLVSKLVATVSPGLTSKLVAWVFLVWASKPIAMVW
jgi:hypothetical protein